MVHLKHTPMAVMLAPIQMSPNILKVNVNKFFDTVSGPGFIRIAHKGHEGDIIIC